MPGVFQFSLDKLEAEIDEVVALGIPAVILFGLPAEKMQSELVHSMIMVLCKKQHDLLKLATQSF